MPWNPSGPPVSRRGLLMSEVARVFGYVAVGWNFAAGARLDANQAALGVVALFVAMAVRELGDWLQGHTGGWQAAMATGAFAVLVLIQLALWWRA